jgi:hypothetical protein
MIKKIFALFVAILFIGGCSSSQPKEAEKTYDNEFITALGKGLDSRWVVAEKDKAQNVPFSTEFTKFPQFELKEIEEYKDKKFEDDKLKELAITYINELKESKKSAEDDDIDGWKLHQNKRLSLLISINNLKEIPVKDKDRLKEMLSDGRKIENNNAKQEAIQNLISSVKFEVDQEKTNQFSTEYYAIVENTTEYNIDYIDLLITLKDSDDVNYRTTYVSQSNWKKGTKVRFEFTDFDQKLAKYEIQVRDVSAEKP